MGYWKRLAEEDDKKIMDAFKLTTLRLNLDKDTLAALERIAVERSVPASKLIRDAVETYIAAQDDKQTRMQYYEHNYESSETD